MPQDKAPATHPEHPSQLGYREGALSEVAAAVDDIEQRRHQALLDKYRTLAELDAELTPDRAELERRETLVLESYAAAGTDDPAALVVIIDGTGTTYRWINADDAPAHWKQEEPPQDDQEPAEPPADTTEPADELSAALAALDAGKGGRG